MTITGLNLITATHDKISAPDGLWGQVFVAGVTLSERVWGAKLEVTATVKSSLGAVKQVINRPMVVRRNGQHNVFLVNNAYYGQTNNLAAGDKVEIKCSPLPLRTYDVFVLVVKP